MHLSEEELRMSVDFCEASLHALTSQICIIDAEGFILFVNRAWERFADENSPPPADYSLHTNYLAVCDHATGELAAEAAPFAQGIRSVLRGTSAFFELTYPCHAPGTPRWFLGRVAPMPVSGGSGAVISHTDITPQHLALNALGETERRYRAMFELSGTGIVIIDRDGVYRMVNATAAGRMGLPPEQIVGSSINNFFPEDVSRVYIQQNREVIDSGVGRDYQATFTLAGKERTFLISDRSIADESGRGILLQSSSLDITEQRRLQDSLRALAGHLQSAREDERRFVAREIHDHFSQVLSALKIDLTLMRTEVLQNDNGRQNSPLVEQLATFDDVLQSVIIDLRHLVNRLRPEMLESLGIINTMSYEVAQFQKSTGLAASFSCNQRNIHLDPESSIALCRILQEALANIRRHAHATEVTVRCACADDSLLLQIEDNGQGFPSGDQHATIPYGILSMQERTTLLRGEFTILRTPRETTLVEVRIPLGSISRTEKP
jgi:PAS domain S-box-containing protein